MMVDGHRVACGAGLSSSAGRVDLLRTALTDIGLPPDFRVVTVTDDEDGSLPGSATFRADGGDLFPLTGPRAALSCRLYRSGPTARGLPELPRSAAGVEARGGSAPHGIDGLTDTPTPI